MATPNWKQLIDLLKQHSTEEPAKRCLETLLNPQCLGHLPSNPGPTRDLYEINCVRAEINAEYAVAEDPDTLTEGYDALLPALSREPDEKIYLFGLHWEREVYTIYTDQTIQRLIGILHWRSEHPASEASYAAQPRTEAHRAKFTSEIAQLRRAQAVEHHP